MLKFNLSKRRMESRRRANLRSFYFRFCAARRTLTFSSMICASCYSASDLRSVFAVAITFRRQGVEEKINSQRDGGKAKPYQVKQVRAVILKYKLGGEG